MISIIVPVYNVEKYLPRCVDSLLNQTYKEFELILVDDGSKDNSVSLCDEYKKKYSNVIVIHQENAGPSVARNKGTEIASGEYITYVDSDDWIHPDYLQKLYDLIIKFNADLSCCSFSFFSKEDELENIPYNDEIEEEMTGMKALELMLYGKLHGSSACALLMKSSIAKSIKFQPGKYHEDDLISFRYFASAEKVGVINKALYFYFQRDGSIMHSPYGQIAIDELNAADFIVENCRKYSEEIQNASLYKLFSNYVDVLFQHPNLKKIDKINFYRVSKTLDLVCPRILKNNKLGKKVRLSALFYLVFGIKGLFFAHKIGVS